MRIFPLGLLLLLLVTASALPVSAADASSTPLDLDTLQARWEASPGDVEAGIAYQDALRTAGREREVVPLFRRAAGAQPEVRGLAFLYGRALGGRDGFRRMTKALDNGLDGADVPAAQRAAAWRVIRDLHIAARAFDQAEAPARAAVRLGASAHDWTLLAWILERGGDLDGAATAYDHAIARRADHLWPRNALALLHAKRGRHVKALVLARKTVALFPEAASAHLHLGLVACLAGDHKAGRAAYDTALKCAKKDTDTLVAIATAYVDLEEHDLAQQALRRALTLDRTHPRALVTAGVLELEKERPANAALLLERATKAAPGDARAWYLLGLSRQRLKEPGKAVRAHKKATRLAPDVLEYRIALALAHAANDQLNLGIAALKRAVQLDPTRPDLHLQLGFLLLKKKRHREALRAMEQVADLDPDDARPYFYIAIIQGDHLGQERKARAALEMYVERGGKEPAALRWLRKFEEQDR